MALIRKFQLKNFKGIEDTEIDLIDRSNCPVLTLIGLNESGKTTILEGISHFVSGDRSVSGLFDGPHASTTGAGLIPVHRKAAFSSDIEVIGLVELDDADVQSIIGLAKKNGYEVDAEALSKPFKISKTFQFEDSVLKKTNNFWHHILRVRKNKRGPFKPYNRPEDESNDLWLKTVRSIEERLPQVSYFPTFLVDMPARIYLQEHNQEKPANRHYRYVFQDILDSLKEDLSLEKHVCNRISDFRASEKSPNWFSIFFGGPTKAPIDSVFQKISNAVTREVLGSWTRVFQRAISAKSIFVEWNIDTERGDMPYASFFVSDGESRYAISERSLGCRWFFSFLLFTAFKQSKQRKTIFIFDEPAANLHAKAQAELLTSFSRIASDGNRVIYSTHSHHMINPQWLSGAYIVENSALDYEIGDTFGLTTKPTNVKAISYRSFVSAYPGRSSYFQPVIEKLQYIVPEVVGRAPHLIVEGISDYYALKLAGKISGKSFCYSLMPSTGAGTCGPIISQIMGRGESFAILLDDDKAGKKEAARYIDGWFLAAGSVLTLGQINDSLSGRKLETIIGDDTLLSIQRHYNSDTKPTKSQIGWYLSEMCGAPSIIDDAISSEGMKNLLLILDYFESYFQTKEIR